MCWLIELDTELVTGDGNTPNPKGWLHADNVTAAAANPGNLATIADFDSAVSSID